MRMARGKLNKLLLALFILLLIIIAMICLDRAIDKSKKSALAIKVATYLHVYFENTHGNFPKNEEEFLQVLISVKYPEIESGSDEYISIEDNGKHILRFYRFHYGIAINDLERKGDELYHKRTGKKIILIEGPYQSDLGDLYNLISVSLYEKMKEEQKGGSNNNITSQDISEIDR